MSVASINDDHYTMAQESPTQITTEFLRRNYAEFKHKQEVQLNLLVKMLLDNWVATVDDLATVSRDSLEKASFPALVIDVLKPEQQQPIGKFCCTCLVLLSV